MKFKNYIFLSFFVSLAPVISLANPIFDNNVDKKNEEIVDVKQIPTGFYIANSDSFYAVQGIISTQTEIIFNKNSTIESKNSIAHTVIVNEQIVNNNQLFSLSSKHSADSSLQLVIIKKHKANKKACSHKPETAIASLALNRPYNRATMLSMANKTAVTSTTTIQKLIKKVSIGTIAKTDLFFYNTTLVTTTSIGTTYINNTSNFDRTYPHISRPPPTV